LSDRIEVKLEATKVGPSSRRQIVIKAD
jgi:hypothetical protein